MYTDYVTRNFLAGMKERKSIEAQYYMPAIDLINCCRNHRHSVALNTGKKNNLRRLYGVCYSFILKYIARREQSMQGNSV